MGDFATTVLNLPTVLFTAPLGLAILYWLFVVIGAVDLDVLDGADGALDGAADGALDGAADGIDGLLDGADGIDGLDGALDALDAADGLDGALDALDGAEGALDGLDGLDGALDGLGESVHTGDPDLDLDGDHVSGPSFFVTLLSVLGLTKVPLTVSLSFILLFGWLTSFLASVHVAPLLPLPSLLVDTSVFLAAFVAGTVGASVAVRPLSGVFHTERGRGNRSFIGSVVTVTTGSVDRTFGQADLAADGHHLLVQVRDVTEQGLSRGDRALLVQWDKDISAFVVERLDPAVSNEETARRAAIDRARRRLLAERKAKRSTQ